MSILPKFLRKKETREQKLKRISREILNVREQIEKIQLILLRTNSILLSKHLNLKVFNEYIKYLLKERELNIKLIEFEGEQNALMNESESEVRL